VKFISKNDFNKALDGYVKPLTELGRLTPIPKSNAAKCPHD